MPKRFRDLVGVSVKEDGAEGGPGGYPAGGGGAQAEGPHEEEGQAQDKDVENHQTASSQPDDEKCVEAPDQNAISSTPEEHVTRAELEGDDQDLSWGNRTISELRTAGADKK